MQVQVPNDKKGHPVWAVAIMLLGSPLTFLGVTAFSWRVALVSAVVVFLVGVGMLVHAFTRPKYKIVTVDPEKLGKSIGDLIGGVASAVTTGLGLGGKPDTRSSSQSGRDDIAPNHGEPAGDENNDGNHRS